ncbi:hypothetical protein [Aliarcobacter cryaerophilus]|uniref:hypothetical protein n=1 Tax=Aliarcobacter cryaerophilus TaxID=28198 RepID=UPI003BB1EAB0
MDYFVIFLIVSFLIRFIFTFFNNKRPTYSYTSDENGHLAHERLLSQKDNLYVYLKEHLFNRTSIGYPTLFHSIAHILFKDDYSISKRRYLSGFFSILFPIIFFLIGINFFDYEATIIASIALLLSLSTFGDFIMQYKSYTARNLADLILFLGYLFIILFYQTNDFIFYFLSIFCFTLVWFSSEFGMQSIIFTSIFWAVISKNTLPIEIVIISIIVASLFFRKKLKSNIGHKIFHWVWYFRNQISILHKKETLDMFSLKSIYKYINSKIFIGKFLQYIPYSILFVYISIVNFEENIFINSFIISTFIIGIFTTTKFFSFLGPGFRYMLFALPYMWIILYQEYSTLAVILLVIECLLSIVYAILVLRELYKPGTNVDYNELDLILEKIDYENNIILLSPVMLNQSFFSRTNNIRAKYYSIWDNDFEPYYLYLHETYMPDYPFLINDYLKLCELKNIISANIFVLNLKVTSKYYSEEFISMLKTNKILYFSDNFLVIEFSSN